MCLPRPGKVEGETISRPLKETAYPTTVIDIPPKGGLKSGKFEGRWRNHLGIPREAGILRSGVGRPPPQRGQPLGNGLQPEGFKRPCPPPPPKGGSPTGEKEDGKGNLKSPPSVLTPLLSTPSLGPSGVRKRPKPPENRRKRSIEIQPSAFPEGTPSPGRVKIE
ncbi:hypothetical protein RRG08_003301 [Elysia crispata]|uniref:Uncharacterized protein n=1 Tax=Elysia crispata TaxID=231223 RepID=A0AAE0ZRV7_9GAST|nr:hypothetical protein RRG08_003301 [Elysia crispata]